MKKIALFLLGSLSFPVAASSSLSLHQASLDQLNAFPILQHNGLLQHANASGLKPLSASSLNGEKITRYQQLYKGLPIVGAQVTVSKKPGKNSLVQSRVNGLVYSEVNIDVTAKLNKQQVLDLAKKSYFKGNAFLQTAAESSELQIRKGADDQLKIAYTVSFRTLDDAHKPAWPFFVIDAQSGEILQYWNNIQTYADTGPGGNEKVHEYWYGKEGTPPLDVRQEGEICTMESDQVRTVNLHYAWDWQGEDVTPYQYTCGSNQEDYVHGAYSVDDDAFYFGHTIINFFKDWYGTYPLQDANGGEQKLIMRVHFGTEFDNAFWDGKTMTFGDGQYLYPLVSLDIAAHEVAHGFTEHNSGLEYHDESGALNESFSDMAGQTARAYLLETQPNLYRKAYMSPELTWTIGETVIPPELSLKAIRFLNLPSQDGISADCVDKQIARRASNFCTISYPELLRRAKEMYPTDLDGRQSLIVHTASGVFNRAFYFMSKQLDVKTAFHVMMVANTKYWTPTSNFQQAACGVMSAADDLHVNRNIVQTSFKKVGIETFRCN